MTRRRVPIGFLVLAGVAVAAAVACGNDPPAETPASATPKDKTEVKMEVAVVDAEAPAPAVAAPGATGAVDPSEDPTIGGPQEATLEKSVAPIRPRLRACYKKALADRPNMAGTATFDTTIGKDGKVASARFVKKEGLNDDMINCLTSAVKAMVFAPDRKSQVVAFSFGPTAPAPSAKAPPPATAPVASYGGSDAGPPKH